MPEYEMIEEFSPLSDNDIRSLSRMFPVRLPTPDGNERVDCYHAGQRSVVEFLIRVRADQIERAKDQHG